MRFHLLWAGLAVAAGGLPAFATNVPIPNAGFETIYKPNTGNTVTETSMTGWTAGLGPSASINAGTVQWSDGTTGNPGDPVNVPGWVSSGSDGVQTSIGEGGTQGVWINGPGFGSSGGTVTSDAAVTSILAGQSYTVSIDLSDSNGGAGVYPVILTLLDQNGNPIPGGVASPNPLVITPAYQTYSLTYSAASLALYAGQGVKIQFGAGAVSGNQTDVDNVALSFTPEPASLGLFGIGAMGMLARRRRALKHATNLDRIHRRPWKRRRLPGRCRISGCISELNRGWSNPDYSLRSRSDHRKEICPFRTESFHPFRQDPLTSTPAGTR